MAHQLTLDAVTVQYDVTPVLDRVSVGVDDGDRIGVVGLNGSGKTTLLAVLGGRRAPDSGRVARRTGLQVAVVGQQDTYAEGATVREVVVPGSSADTEHDWAADPRVRAVVEGLGLAGLGLDRPVAGLSGGERRRVSLAAALVSDADLVVLDEPTNHLDLEGVRWLAAHLQRRPGALVVVTHDRWFLDTVCTRTWEVVSAGVQSYDGGYADWVFARAERQRVADVTEERRRNLARKELAWLRRGAPARTSKPRFRIEAANALIADVPPPRSTTTLQATATARLGRTVVDLVDATVELGGRRLLDGLTWRLAPGTRYGILGPNGAGKTTLLDVLLGRRGVDAGERVQGTTVRFGRLSQDLAELDPGLRTVEAVAEIATTVRIGDQDLSAGQLLERVGFPGATHRTYVRDLSGGQRRRLQLARVLMAAPNVLVLDEPTNDLDVDTLAALEDLLDGWVGTLVVVSHDRYLLERVCDDLYAVLGDGRLTHLPGGVEEYLRRRADAVPDSPSATRAAAPSAPTTSASDQRAARKTLARVERRLTALEQAESRLHTAMVEHATDAARTLALQRDLAVLHEERKTLEAEWYDAAEALGE